MSGRREEARGRVVCKRCGDPLCAWVESKSGKPMLVSVDVDAYGRFTVKPNAPYEFHVCMEKKSPAQIDSALSQVWQYRQTWDVQCWSWQEKIRAIEAGRARPFDVTQESFYREQIASGEAHVAAAVSFAEPYEDEYARRGGWHRYFLVQNTGGHVHREMTCSTCFPTTRYAWLIELADCDEGEMIEQYGETACTVCFPDAPTHPAWARSVEERERAEQAKKASECPGSRTLDGDDVNGSKRLYRPWARCRHCGEGVSVTSTGKLRAHKLPHTQEVAR